MVDSPDAPSPALADCIPELDRLAADLMSDWQVPGAAIAVVQDGRVTLTRAWGRRDVEAGLPVTPATQFMIASITKSFTATAVALLHHEGRLDWTRPVRDVLPEFRLHDPVASERLTIQDLLSHVSGLPAHDWAYLPGDLSSAELLGVMRHLEPSHDFRSAYAYSNLGYNVLGVLIERVSGQSYDAFIRSGLTDRLGMTISVTPDALDAAADAARPYMMRNDAPMPAVRLPFQAIAAGAINTSVADLASWMLLHLGKGEVDGDRLLPATLIDALHTPRVYYQTSPDFGAAHYGFGFRCQSYRGDRVVFHGGGLPGWGGRITLLPDFGIGVAVLTNRSPVSDVPGVLSWYVIDRLRGRAPIDWLTRSRNFLAQAAAQSQADSNVRETARPTTTRPAHDLAAYAGDYDHPAYGRMTITAQNQALHWSWRGFAAPLRHLHFETFELAQWLHPLLWDRLPITFLTDRGGMIVSLSVPFEPAVKDIVFTRRMAG